MWRRYEIGTMPTATIDAILAVAWILAERLKRQPTGAEIQREMQGG